LRLAESLIQKKIITGRPSMWTASVHIISPLIWSMIAPALPPRQPARRRGLSGESHEMYAGFDEIRAGRSAISDGRDIHRQHERRLWLAVDGLQTFAFGNEPPILMAADDAVVVHRTPATPGFPQTRLRHKYPTRQHAGEQQRRHRAEAVWQPGISPGHRSNLATLIDRRTGLWTVYAYTPVSAVVVWWRTSARSPQHG
jgi:hypothetical protein